MSRTFSFLAAAAVALMVAGSAVAQGPHPEPGGLVPGASQNQDLPVQIDAKSLEVRDRQKTATFTGEGG